MIHNIQGCEADERGKHIKPLVRGVRARRAAIRPSHIALGVGVGTIFWSIILIAMFISEYYSHP